MRNNHDQIIDDHIYRYIDANRGPCHIPSTSPRRQCKRLQQARMEPGFKVGGWERGAKV